MNGHDNEGCSEAICLMLAYLCISTEKDASLERKVEILDKFRLSDAQIASVTGSKNQSIRNARHNVKKHARKGS